MAEFPDHAQLSNISLIEELYSRYLADPESVDISWRHFFEGIDFGAYLYKRGGEPAADFSQVRIADLILAYRRYGHLQARCNPLQTGEKRAPALALEQLGFFSSELDQLFPTLGFCGKKAAPLREIIAALEEIYCGPIGFEYMDLGRPELEKWVQGRLEPELAIQPSIEEQHLLLEYLNRSEVFETFLHTKYVGQTRFSLEGAETMIPILAEMIDLGGNLGIEEMWIGMAHRGRLNVLTTILNKPYSVIFEEFEDDTALSFSGNDDVRYHLGYVGELQTRSGKKITVSMAANPSHLESVDPVVLGQVYGEQIQRKKEKSQIAPLLIHGDASLAGQGVIYESLQLMNLPSYAVGGTLHLVVNNQIGYTTLPEEGRSTRYCTDIAKAFGCPVFHVNAEDPESCLFAAKMAVEIRQKFQCDVFIDLLCYRKYGHNEGDEPSFTQPLQYQLIRSKKGIRQLYYEKLISASHLEQKVAEALEEQFKETLKKALIQAQERKQTEKPPVSQTPFEPTITAVDKKTLQSIIALFCEVPQGFHLHPKLQKWLQDRIASLQGKIDWSTAECLAFGSLLSQEVPIRLAGQDSQRGTFSQRHMVWIDTETGAPYSPLNKIPNAPLEIVNSPLTEYAGMAFEVGYTWSAKNALVLWEAQYGDFDNGAQIVIDQYIACGEQKWNSSSSITLLLPHGYEGAGPEHSSARIERFLQLSAGDNIQVVNPSTPAQYFHLLRRQALLKKKKPLIVFTPKSLLRNAACTSQISDFIDGGFEEILNDPTPPARCKRLLFCTGKIFYDLLAVGKPADVAIVRFEQLYPLHIEKIKRLLSQYKEVTEYVWVQEEPKNMGAWSFMSPILQQEIGNILYVGREANATTATGSSKKHKQEQAALVKKALGIQ